MADAAKPGTPAAKYEPPKELEQKAAVQKFQGRPKRQPVEQAEYFYSVKLTHIVFFASSVGMLVAFLMMVEKDYDRPWKPYQIQFYRMDFEKLFHDMNDLAKAEAKKKDVLAAIDRKIDAFLKIFRGGREISTDLMDPEQAKRVKDLPLTVHVDVNEEKRKLVVREIEGMRGELYAKQQNFNFAKDDLGEVRYRYEEATHAFKEAQETRSERLPDFEKTYLRVKEEWDAANQKVANRKREFDDADLRNTFYLDLNSALEARPVRGFWDKPDQKPLVELVKEKTEITKEFDEKRGRFDKERPGFANTVRDLPMLDFFRPKYKVNQVILEDLKDQLNFIKVIKVDRCMTCHTAIMNKTYAVEKNPDAPAEVDRLVFKDPFLKKFVAHALGRGDPKDCDVCDLGGRKGTDAPQPLTAHGAWSSDDAIQYTKVFMAHPRLDLFVNDSSKHPLPRFGCTICHEGDGRDTDFSRVVHTPNDPQQAQDWRRRHGTPYGEEKYNWNYRELWDLPMFPSKFIQSSCRRCHQVEVELDGAEKFVKGMKLYERVGCYGCHKTDNYKILPKDLLDLTLDPNQKYRRPGPPLTRIATKVTPDWAWNWVMGPREFRPTTRMPHFFKQSNARSEVNHHPYKPSEIDGVLAATVVKYIFGLSETKSEDPDLPGLKGDAVRGELLVSQVGCIACHKFQETTPEEYAKQNKSRYLEEFAPNLSGIASKISDKKWLYNWVRDPKRHFHQSRMPNLRLSDQEAVDVVEYLMTLKKADWDKRPGILATNDRFFQLLDDLILEQKSKGPDYVARLELEDMKAKEKSQPDPKDPKKMLDPEDPQARIRWLGKKMVKNYGCYSCHELRNDEPKNWLAANFNIDWSNEEGIGVELTGTQPFGSKAVDRLDFGFTEYDGVNYLGVTFKHGYLGEIIEGQTKDVQVRESRAEWLAWKLRNPRIFDGGKMEAKPWDELLRMPNFGFSDVEIELLSTFILSFTDHAPAGLVAGAVKRMGPDEIAMNRGNRIVRDENCRACHRLSLDRFEIEWSRKEPDKEPGKLKTVTSWVEVEGRNLGKATADQAEGPLKAWGFTGSTKKPGDEALELYSIDWAADHRTLALSGAVNPDNKAVVYDGHDWWYLDTDGTRRIRRPIRRHLDMDGGEILPLIAKYKKKLADNPPPNQGLDDLPDMDPGQLEARYPPMLRTQGVKTQADWLFGFLKSPRPIRPNLFPLGPGVKSMPDTGIRMPTFEFSDEEAGSLARWFAVRDQLKDAGPYPNPAFKGEAVDVYPYTDIPERSPSFLAQRKDIHPRVMTGILLEREKGCVSCHFVNGKAPQGDPVKYAPDLAVVERRLRPRWLYSWLNDPSTIYPRTTMTNYWSDLKNPGRRDEIDAAVEVLLNFGTLNSPKPQ
jgi:cytochrome c551/c552/cbb3-type cytochrome oxidase cytochrome c subunit